MLVTSPPEKNTTIQGSAKHCGNVPKWEFQLSLQHKQRGMSSLEVRPAEH